MEVTTARRARPSFLPRARASFHGCEPNVVGGEPAPPTGCAARTTQALAAAAMFRVNPLRKSQRVGRATADLRRRQRRLRNREPADLEFELFGIETSARNAPVARREFNVAIARPEWQHTDVHERLASPTDRGHPDRAHCR